MCNFFFVHTATPVIYTLSLHDALPIYHRQRRAQPRRRAHREAGLAHEGGGVVLRRQPEATRALPHRRGALRRPDPRSEEHTSELQSPVHLVCRLLLEKKNIRLNRRDDE